MTESSSGKGPIPGAEAASPWGHLQTEGRHPASAELDRLPAAEIVTLMLEEDGRGD